MRQCRQPPTATKCHTCLAYDAVNPRSDNPRCSNCKTLRHKRRDLKQHNARVLELGLPGVKVPDGWDLRKCFICASRLPQWHAAMAVLVGAENALSDMEAEYLAHAQADAAKKVRIQVYY